MDSHILFQTRATRKAYAVACMAHTNQVDKAGVPYIRHPMEVASAMPDETTVAAALLHDVLEDTKFTADDLLDLGVPGDVVDLVIVLTRRAGEPYFDYICRIKGNEKARLVKLADLRHNSDLTRLPVVTEQDKSRLKRYQRAIEMLTANLEVL